MSRSVGVHNRALRLRDAPLRLPTANDIFVGHCLKTDYIVYLVHPHGCGGGPASRPYVCCWSVGVIQPALRYALLSS
jgi:hypothetical protein